MTNHITPEVLWAQRADKVMVSIQLEEVTDETITVDSTNLKFSGKSHAKDYQVALEFNQEIIPNESRQRKGGREYYFELKKKETGGPWWPRLLKEKVKPKYLKTDFNRWRDEDDSEDDAGNNSFEDASLEDMMQQMGTGAGGAGAYDPPDAPYSDDSDDEEPPELETDTGK